MIAAFTDENKKEILEIADRLQLKPRVEGDDHTLGLGFRDDRLCLFEVESPKALVFVDFLQHFEAMTKTSGFSSGTPLAKAVGASKLRGCKLVDGTAGLGKDSLVLAALGFDVVAFEKSPVVFELLQDGVRRACGSCSDIVSRIDFRHQDFLDGVDEEVPDVIYLDPMYPEKKKSALPKKEMRIFQQFLSPESDVEKCLKEARARAKDRVVVKRPPKSTLLEASGVVFEGKTVRFEMYKGT